MSVIDLISMSKYVRKQLVELDCKVDKMETSSYSAVGSHSITLSKGAIFMRLLCYMGYIRIHDNERRDGDGDRNTSIWIIGDRDSARSNDPKTIFLSLQDLLIQMGKSAVKFWGAWSVDGFGP